VGRLADLEPFLAEMRGEDPLGDRTCSWAASRSGVTIHIVVIVLANGTGAELARAEHRLGYLDKQRGVPVIVSSSTSAAFGEHVPGQMEGQIVTSTSTHFLYISGTSTSRSQSIQGWRMLKLSVTPGEPDIAQSDGPGDAMAFRDTTYAPGDPAAVSSCA